MKGFFDRLAEHQSAPEALANSQRAFLKQRRSTDGDPWLHPYFWAVYTVAGDSTLPVAGGSAVTGTAPVTTGLPTAPFGYEYASFYISGAEGYFQVTVAPE